MYRKHLFLLGFLFLFLATSICARTQDAPLQGQDLGAPPAGNRGPGRGGPRDGRSTVGKISAINGNSIELTKPDGTKVTVKFTETTEFRKDRHPAKLGDFKVGDFAMVHGEENADHSVTAQMIGGRSGNGATGGGGARFASGFGEQGKDYVAGEVKSIDAPKLTVLRSDNITQTLELNEETSLRRGHDSITMADIHPGDHVIIRGASQNNALVPKDVMVLSAEQWERMQQMMDGSSNGPAGTAPATPPASNQH
jgi:hypothetical protein